jgi:hypothetical protein
VMPRVTHLEVPTPGLPEDLPLGEEILWQGSPSARALARSAFHVRALGIYFAILLVLRGYNAWSDSQSLSHTALAVLWLLPLAVAVIAMCYLMAWLTAKTTVYTVTSERVVLHIGVVLDLTLNLPYQRLEGVALHLKRDGTGDLPLRIMAPTKIAYAHLWPHARPWRLAHPEPMLRAIPDAAQVGRIIAEAMARVVDGSLNRPTPNFEPQAAAQPVALPASHARPMATA